MSKKSKTSRKGTPSNSALPKWVLNSPEKKSDVEKWRAIFSRAAFRKVRNALNLSQQEMAEQLQTSLATVQGIESGYRPVVLDVAIAVQSRFGVFATSVQGYTDEPITLLGERVSIESVARVLQKWDRPVGNEEVELFTKPLEVVVRAAAKCGKLLVLGANFQRLVRELATTLDLKPSIREELDETGPAKRHITWGEIRNSPALAKGLGIRDMPKKRDSDIAYTLEPTSDDHAPLFKESKLLPKWKTFVDSEGSVQWASQTKTLGIADTEVPAKK